MTVPRMSVIGTKRDPERAPYEGTTAGDATIEARPKKRKLT
jgi:hypothetical protein